jgi:hypothetical protein
MNIQPRNKNTNISKLFKRPLTSKDCSDWKKNKQENPLNPKNPISNYRIKYTSPIYKEFDKLCDSTNDIPKPKPKSPPKKDGIIDKLFKRPLTSKDCSDWKKNKQENPSNPKNPVSGYRIKDVSPIYKKLDKLCDLSDDLPKPKPKSPQPQPKPKSKSPQPKKDVIVSKLFKRPLTSKDCIDWKKNKLENPSNPKNPVSGYRIKEESPIYKELNKLCDLSDDRPKPKTKLKVKSEIKIAKRTITTNDCYEWEKNKNINPINGKPLLETDKTYQELDKLCNFCNKVVTIPQYLGTCWFNAMLMSILYSQNSRKLLLYDNIYANQKTNKLYRIINRILTKNYVSKEKASKYFTFMRPEKILEYYIESPKFMKRFNIKNGDNYCSHLPNFIKSLGKTCITIDKDDNMYYLNIIKIFSLFKRETDDLEDNDTELAKKLIIHFKSVYNKILKELKQNNPDYIFVNIYPQDKNIVNGIVTSVLTDSYYYNIDNPVNKFLKFDGLKTHEPLIHFNGDTYILDSCLLSDYKHTRAGHAIAGISCKNQKYVYNGWIRTTNDPSILNKDLFKQETMPCELMKYEWNVNKDEEFCLNSVMCKLDKAKKDDELCFSFGKGQRTLVYVKMNKLYKSIDKDISKSSS